MRYSIRHLLILTTLCGLVLAGYLRYRHLEERARFHERQAEAVVRYRWTYLLSLVPQEIEDKMYDREERLHHQLAAEYRQQIWRPWVKITQPDPPLTNWTDYVGP